MHLCKPWPKELPQTWHPVARVVGLPKPSLDQVQEELARQRFRRMGGHHQNSNLSGTWSELMFVGTTAYTAVSGTSTESNLLAAGSGIYPIPAGFFGVGRQKTIAIRALGVMAVAVSAGGLAATSFAWTLRLNTSPTFSNSSTSDNISVAANAAAGCNPNVSSMQWEMNVEITCTTFLVNTSTTAGTVLQARGWVESPGGLVSPFKYAMAPSSGLLGAWTATIRGDVAQYPNLSVAMANGVASANNTITCQRLEIAGRN